MGFPCLNTIINSLFKQQMWWMIAIAISVLAAVAYAYNISGSVKVATPKEGCNSCPKKDNPMNY